MEYTSFIYVIFLAICGILYYVLPKKMQWIVLLIASLAFYVSIAQILVLYMLATTLIVYLSAIAIQRHKDDFKSKKSALDKAERKALKEKTKAKQKRILTATVVVTIGVLAALKYCNFFGSIVNGIGSIFSATALVPVFKIALPLGISYYTLMTVSYIVDVYRGTIKAEKNYFRLLLFVSYFPHIMEGPFDRYDKLDAQFREPHSLDYDVIKNGALLIMYGLFKKLVIADRAGLIVSGIFDSQSAGGTSIFVGMLVYTLQLYADFSGCIDIVSGTSQMFGINVAENFRQPFFSHSINEFWRRWHITLGLWLKEYVFYPVSLSKNFKNFDKFVKKHVKNDYLTKMIPAAYALFFVWFCNGIWHGASGKYIFYGLYYYLLMMLGEFAKPLCDSFCQKAKIDRESKVFGLFQIARTFIIVNIGMLIFRSATLADCGAYIAKMFTSFDFGALFNGTIAIKNVSNYDYLVLILGVAVLFVIGLLKEKGHSIRAELFAKPLVLRWSIYLVLIFSTIILGIYGGNFENAGMIYAEF